MTDWNPGDLCQVRRGKRWVDAEVMTAVPWAFMVAVGDRSVRILERDIGTSVRPRPAPRGKLPEPKAADHPHRHRMPGLTDEQVEEGMRWEAANGILHDRAHVDDGPTRPGKSVRTPLKPVPKPTTARSLAYLAHVRRHPCCSCGREEGIHAHHIAGGGMGSKCSDYYTAPLCGVCHQHLHATASLPTMGHGVISGDSARAVMWKAAARCLEEWITREGER